MHNSTGARSLSIGATTVHMKAAADARCGRVCQLRCFAHLRNFFGVIVLVREIIMKTFVGLFTQLTACKWQISTGGLPRGLT